MTCRCPISSSYSPSDVRHITTYGVDLSTSKCIALCDTRSYYLWVSLCCCSVDYQTCCRSIHRLSVLLLCSCDLGPHYYQLWLPPVLVCGTYGLSVSVVWLCALAYCCTYVLPVHQTCGVAGSPAVL